jgi:hypothetical protein
MPPWDPALAAKATLISLHKHYKFQLTMPPWDPAPAETQFIGPAPTLPQNKTTPLVTKQTTPSTSKAMEKEIVFESREKKYQDEIIGKSDVLYLHLVKTIVVHENHHFQRIKFKNH